ncbi:RNA polymerase II transcription factor SIII (Elongin) subunit A domain-containing protein [Sarocladium implicatum]|nr:RNA polymerase II transcription factor SIII (Elongin) subunit A domain-containing protein [Sarocladium implicatum]
MPVKSLMDLAMMTIFKNVKELTNAGDFLPYETLRPILLKVDSARQLRQLELNSPQIEGETGEVWLKLIEKDFPMEYRAQLFKPPDPSKWYRVYEKYKKIHDRRVQESEAKLREALAGFAEDNERNTSKIVNKKLPSRVVKRRGGPADHTVSSMTFNRGSRTKTLNGAGVMRKVRRETKEIANIHGSLSKVFPPSSRNAALRQIKVAPTAMVEAHRRAANPSYRAAPKRPVEKSAVLQAHEDQATYISDYGSDDDDGFGGEDLFDGTSRTVGGFSRPKPTPASPPKPKSKAPVAAMPASKPSSSSLSARKGRGLLSTNLNKSAVIVRTEPKSRPQAASPPSSKSRDEPRIQARPSHSDSTRVRSDSVRGSGSSSQEPVKSRTQESAARHRSGAPDAAQTAGSLSPVPNPLLRKRKAVDVFMRSNKRGR